MEEQSSDCTNDNRLDNQPAGSPGQPSTLKQLTQLPSPMSTPEKPPPPPPKDTPYAARLSASFDFPLSFNPLRLQRPGSIYTLSRSSLANQLAQLTSIQLPDADSLSGRLAAIPTAQAATTALVNAAEPIRGWIYKASEVIGGLDSEDDVEWAAAGGREGVHEVENAATRFEKLINVYVTAIEEMQGRDDMENVSPDDLTTAVSQMDSITAEWSKIRETLLSVKVQVEIAMEWEELWDVVLGDIQNEMDDLVRLVFEMEERRHRSMIAVANGDGVDINDLETMVDQTPAVAARHSNHLSLTDATLDAAAASTTRTSGPAILSDDSSLFALVARMQPLRASLDFLPMRLSGFQSRAKDIFPMACDELEERQRTLNASYAKLEKDAESLRKELGEDRWVLVFRGAGRKAQKMYESVDRGVSRLAEAVDMGMHLTNPVMIAKKIESYEAKKTHYAPAISRLLTIFNKGLKERLTVNGEILRLYGELQMRWQELQRRMAELDVVLEDLQSDKSGQQLRDSISSMLSNDHSITGGTETPASSPPSSVVMPGLRRKPPLPITPSANRRSPSAAANRQHARRPSYIPTPTNASSLGYRSPRSVSGPAEGRGTPLPHRTHANKPRWNRSTNLSGVDTGHNFKPLSLTTPSQCAKQSTPIRKVSSSSSSSSHMPSLSSKLPTRSPLGLGSRSDYTPPKSAASIPGLPSPPASRQTPPALAKSHLLSHKASSAAGDRRSSFQPLPTGQSIEDDVAPRRSRSLAAIRGFSMLPTPRSKAANRVGSPPPLPEGHISQQTNRTTAFKKEGPKPRWRL